MEKSKFNYAEAVKNGSLEKCYQFELGKVYTKEIKIYQNPVIANGPYGIRQVSLKIRSTPFNLITGKTYKLTFLVTFLRDMSVEIEVQSAQEIKA